MTGKGFFIVFAPTDEPSGAEQISRAISIDLPTRLPAPKDLAGFTLFLEAGRPTSFEGYFFGPEAWPDQPMEKWLIPEPIEALKPKQS